MPDPVALLAEPVRRWIHQQGWTQLRDVQAKAIPAVLAGGDVMISARTAAGKTEAALLPLLTRLILARESGAPGFGVVYVSPLKALINDQHRRLEGLCEACDVPLHKWHGDVSAADKKRARDRPSGVLLITPESLEATLVRRGREIPRLFGGLAAFVIDELHAFIGTERGIQLQSLLSRIEQATKREQIDRIGLSATLGDLQIACAAMRPRPSKPVAVVEGLDHGTGVKLQVRGYLIPRAEPQIPNANGVELQGREDATEQDVPPIVPPQVAADMFRLLRGRSNLLFAGSRANVEAYADALRDLSERNALPNEFFAHHGSLSKQEREHLEARLREDPRPTTAVATTTLELGIDIGDVETIAQVGPGVSVASMRQRLGRSGRREGKPAIMRIFVLEKDIRKGDHPLDALRLDLVQSIAMVEALAAGWCEPPNRPGLHLSTLLHQILALIVQTGGLTAAAAFRALCERGAFVTVNKALFITLLKAMAAPERALIEQSPESLLMVGKGGERLTESYEFYTVFATELEYRVIHESKTLGTYPISITVAVGQTIIFTGRRWRIERIDDDARVIEVKPARRADPPKFNGLWGGVHDHIVAGMKDVLADETVPEYLDDAARTLLAQAREAFRAQGLATRSTIPYGSGTLLLPWVGTKKLTTLALAFNALEMDASTFGHAIELLDHAPHAVMRVLRRMAAEAPPPPEIIAAKAAKPHRAKFDPLLPRDLMNLVTVVEQLDVGSIPSVAADLALDKQL
ncbi:MAG: DEAD/DEAH box helicase [Hyphomonas sp.]|jgi:ATP-dependent Lhr-like helicase|nr:DEAD/DEAH box helicase [Hyphomonas sp.]